MSGNMYIMSENECKRVQTSANECKRVANELQTSCKRVENELKMIAIACQEQAVIWHANDVEFYLLCLSDLFELQQVPPSSRLYHHKDWRSQCYPTL